MKLNELIIELKKFYAQKGIDNVKNRPRFNALEKVIAFYTKILNSNNPEIDEVFKLNKNEVRDTYGQMKENKLNAAEKQVFNDLYNVYSNIVNP